jgi:CRP-like cAMP-binding protein
VRLKSTKDSNVEHIVTQQFKQLVISQPYSFFDWSAVENLTSRKGNVFDHFLSFLDFSAEEKTFSQIAAVPEGKIVERNSWDAQGMKLGIYFQYSINSLAISFRYDKNQFSLNAGEYIANLYNLILRQMLVYWHAPFSDFIENIKKIAAEMSAREDSTENENQKIIDFIYKSKILQSESTGSTSVLVENSKLLTRFEGDRIYGDILEKNLVFVVEGKLSRSLDTGEGWFNALDIIKADDLINESIFSPKRRAVISAEVLTEKAVLLAIPLVAFESATRQSPALYKSVLQHISSQMEKYQMLWLQS